MTLADELERLIEQRQDPDAIWLSPQCDDTAHHGDGRSWAAPAPESACEDCGLPWVRYVRADHVETDRLKKQLGLALEALESIAAYGDDGAEGTAQDALDDITRVGMEAAAIAEGGEHGAG